MAESKSELSQEQRVLAARARALATPRRLRDEGSERREVISFAAGTERYGIEIGVVQEVRPLELGAFCRVPCTPAFVVGVVNIRGRVHTVIDLGAALGQPARPLADTAHVVLVATGGDGAAVRREVAVLADEMPTTVGLADDRLRPPPETVSADTQGFVRGVTEDMLIFLDIARLLDDPRITVRDGE